MIMYQQRTGLILFVVLLLGTILQGIGLFTQGWRIVSSTSLDYSTAVGLWSLTSCSSGDCTSTTYYDSYKEAMVNNPKSSAGIPYAAKVGQQIIGLLSFTCCLASSVLTFLIYRDHTHKERMSLLVTCLLLVAGSLIWTIIGTTAADTAAFARRMDNDSKTVIGFPYSLFLSSVGSVLSLFVALVNFYTAWVDKQPPQSKGGACTLPLTQSAMQMNVQHYSQQPVVQTGYIQQTNPYVQVQNPY